jgi:hypothetical protein
LTDYGFAHEKKSKRKLNTQWGESMNKHILAALLWLIVALSAAITVETGSLRDFLVSDEPACAYDNWVSHLAEGIAIANYNLYAPYDVQTTGFGDFRIPNDTEVAYWNNMLDLFCAGDYEGAQTVLNQNAAPFQIVEFHDTDTGRTYYMIRELPNLTYVDDNDTADTYDDETGAFAYGWGLFIYNPQGTKPIIITVPHPCDDFPTPMFGLAAMNRWNAKYLLINGAGREVRWTNEGSYTNTKSLSDPTRNAAHPLQVAYVKFADKVRDEQGWREFSPQMHSYDWNRHPGYANCQISAGNPRNCPNLPIRDLSPLKNDLINNGEHLMIPANTVGLHRDVYLNDFYGVNYTVHDFTFQDGIYNYPVNNSIDLPAYTQNRQMIYTQTGTTDYDVYDPFFHVEMDELPNEYDETNNVYHWFYGWDELSQSWDMDNLFTHFEEYYDRWLDDMDPALLAMFELDDDQPPVPPTNLAVVNQSLNGVALSWTKGSGYDFDSYEILYATEPIGDSNYQVFNRTNNAFLASPDCEGITVTNLVNSNPYYFKIRAKDKNSNVTVPSNEVNTILSPANVYSLTAHGLDSKVRVYWQVNGQTNNQGFSVYRSENAGLFSLVDSWQTNANLTNPAAYNFEWWDYDVANGNSYTYKVSSTNLNNIEFFYNYPATAAPRPIHFITIRNTAATLADSIAFSANPYASDGNDAYWDTTKANPGNIYVWNAFWEQYWGNSGTALSREIKGDYDQETQIKTWVMRTRSDQLETLSISASDNFDRAEKLYLQDGGTYHNLLGGPYQFSNQNSNVRTMTLFWGNMQPKVTFNTMQNKVYQGGGTINFGWGYQYPFLIEHVELSIQNATDSLLVSALVPNNQFSFSWMVPVNVTEMQDCRFIADVIAVDGVRTRYVSTYRFTLLPMMALAYNEGGLKMRTNPWLNTDLSFNQVFGPCVAYEVDAGGDWALTEDYDFGHAYWVQSQDVNFYSGTYPVQSSEYSIDLSPGWNFVPNPHLCAYDLEDLSFTVNGSLFTFGEMLAQELISRAVYVYRNGVYEPVTRIEPWEAFLIMYNGGLGIVSQIRFYPFFDGPQVTPPEPSFDLRVSVDQAYPGAVKLGLNPFATDTHDFTYDLPTPPFPPLTDASALWIYQTNADTTAAWNLFSEYKSEFTGPEQQKFWNIRLHAGTTDPKTFSFESSGDTAEWQILMMLNDVPYYVGSPEDFVWTPPAVGTYDGYIRVSNYHVGVEDLVQSPLSGLTAYPNPFNPDVNIAFNLNVSNDVDVDIYNIRGQKVKTLASGKLSGGAHNLRWDGRDAGGRNVASGIYFARVHTKNETQIIKMMLMK